MHRSSKPNGNLKLSEMLSFRALALLSNDVVSLQVENNDNLQILSLPALLSSNIVNVYNNDQLTSIDISAYESGEAFTIQSNPLLENIYSNSLQSISSFLSIYNNANLQELSFPELTQVGNGNGSSGLNIYSNDALQSIEGDNITNIYGTLNISENAQLTQTSFDSLAQIGAYLKLADNPMLPLLSLPISQNELSLRSR